MPLLKNDYQLFRHACKATCLEGSRYLCKHNLIPTCQILRGNRQREVPVWGVLQDHVIVGVIVRVFAL